MSRFNGRLPITRLFRATGFVSRTLSGSTSAIRSVACNCRVGTQTAKRHRNAFVGTNRQLRMLLGQGLDSPTGATLAMTCPTPARHVSSRNPATRSAGDAGCNGRALVRASANHEITAATWTVPAKMQFGCWTVTASLSTAVFLSTTSLVCYDES